MARLRWCKHSRSKQECGLAGRGRVLVDYTDLVQLAHISDPIFLQPDAGEEGVFFYNHYVR